MSNLVDASRRLQQEQRRQTVMKQRVHVWWHMNCCPNCAANRADFLKEALSRIIPGETGPAFKSH